MPMLSDVAQSAPTPSGPLAAPAIAQHMAPAAHCAAMNLAGGTQRRSAVDPKRPTAKRTSEKSRLSAAALSEAAGTARFVYQIAKLHTHVCAPMLRNCAASPTRR